MRSILFVTLTLVGYAFAGPYNGFKIYKVTARTEFENAFLRTLEGNTNLDFLSRVNKVGNPVSIMVPPDFQNTFEDHLTGNNILFFTEVEDVERISKVEQELRELKKPLKSGRIRFDQYSRHEEMNSYLDQLAQDYPDTVTVETIGQSFQARDMKVIRISSGTTDPPKPSVFIDAGIHAREWIAPAVALYLINQLVENPDNSDLIQNVDWIILPNANPDGYEFTWDNSRYWRKTLSDGVLCEGCDANRNFGYHWMEAGANDNECSEMYAGKGAFSEDETKNIRDYVNRTENIQGYLSLHSYGLYILYPWSYTDVKPENADELQELGESINEAIGAAGGPSYVVGSTGEILYAAAGASQDWFMGEAGVRVAFSIELPAGGFTGFDMRASEIERVAAETFEGLKVFGKYFDTKK